MISVVIPTLNAAGELPETLAALVPAAVSGLVKEVIVSDGGSADATLEIAEAAGARAVCGEKGRGGQLARGAAIARGRWLLFLHADTRLESSWTDEVSEFISDERSVGVFTLKFDAEDRMAKLVAAGAMLRTRLLKSPYGDQGLLISRALYREVGGYSDLPLFEDVDIIDRLVRKFGRRSVRVLKTRAVTSAARYQADGYGARIVRNLTCLLMYKAGVAPARIAAFYRSS